MSRVSFDKQRKHLAQTIFKGVGEERIVEQTQGCWNCIHSNVEKAKNLWWSNARATWLASATKIALGSPKGEEDPQVRMIRRKVPAMDVAIEKGEWCCCSTGIRTTDGKEQPVADFVHIQFLCRKWTGKQGASVAREGQKADKLPEELMEDLMDPKGGIKA